MHSGCLLRSRKYLSGEIKLLQKPESLWLEQLILPSSDTSLVSLPQDLGISSLLSSFRPRGPSSAALVSWWWFPEWCSDWIWVGG